MVKELSESCGDPADYAVLFWNDECAACAAFEIEEAHVSQRPWKDEDFKHLFKETEESCEEEEHSVF